MHRSTECRARSPAAVTDRNGLDRSVATRMDTLDPTIWGKDTDTAVEEPGP